MNMPTHDKLCRQCAMPREQWMQYPGGCPLVVPALGCPFYDAPRSAARDITPGREECHFGLPAPASSERAQEPDGWAVLFMPGTEHFCYVGIWTQKEIAENMLSKTRGGDSTMAPMYFAPRSASRSTILEEAAKVCDGRVSGPSGSAFDHAKDEEARACAREIRSLARRSEGRDA